MPRPDVSPEVLVVMGVTGSGKTTVGAILADRLGWPFEDGDSLHPQTNIDKMVAGHPLTDEDRWPWLETIAGWVDARLEAGESGVITCSALKRAYRDLINRARHGVVFVYLHGSKETIAARLAVRYGHFMPARLLDSQFADLEPPAPDEPALSLDVGPPPQVIAQEVMAALDLSSA